MAPIEKTLPEILLHIASAGALDVTSLLKLSWTSKTMQYLILTNRALWLMTVRRLLADEQIPEFATHFASLDSAGLVQYATRTGRFFHSASSRLDTPALFSRVEVTLGFQVLPSPLLISGDPPAMTPPNLSILSCELLPGGRFVLGIYSVDTLWVLACWDLRRGRGVKGANDPCLSPTVFAPIGSKRLHGPPCPSIVDFFWATQDKSLIVLLKNESQLEIRKWEYADTQTFSKVAALPIQRASCSIAGNHVLIRQNPSQLWNWRTGVLSSGFTDPPTNDPHHQYFTASGVPFDVGVFIHSGTIRAHFTPLVLRCCCHESHATFSCPKPALSADHKARRDIHYTFVENARTPPFHINWNSAVRVSPAEVILYLRVNLPSIHSLLFSISNDVKPTFLGLVQQGTSLAMSRSFMSTWGDMFWSSLSPRHGSPTEASSSNAPQSSTAYDESASEPLVPGSLRLSQESSSQLVVQVQPYQNAPAHNVAIVAAIPEDANILDYESSGFCPRSGTWAFRKYPSNSQDGNIGAFTILLYD
ncbi:hypothetical protein DL93DRAFT_2165878 [Clavulina sp. PMI_390]|nr:hypothetical protein DL93DRAFT_2165878 [Clavulina sp. PMI_390]